MEGEKKITGPFKESLARRRGQSNCLETPTPLSVGPSNIQKEGGSWASKH